MRFSQEESDALRAFYATRRSRQFRWGMTRLGALAVAMVATVWAPWTVVSAGAAILAFVLLGWSIRDFTAERRKRAAWDIVFGCGPGTYGFILGFALLQGETESPLIHMAATYAARIDLETRIAMEHLEHGGLDDE